MIHYYEFLTQFYHAIVHVRLANQNRDQAHLEDFVADEPPNATLADLEYWQSNTHELVA